MLSLEQKYIVSSTLPLIHVNAVPGSGKTYTAIACIKKWLSQGVSEKNILVLGFSSTTSENIKNRLKNDFIKVCTIHSLGYSLSQKAKFITEPESLAVITAIAKKLFGADNFLHLNSVLIKSLMSKANSLQADLQEVMKEDRYSCLKRYASKIKKIDNEYQSHKKRKSVLDFDDMITTIPSHTLNSLPWTHIIVDEAQDCSVAQAELLKSLIKAPHVKYFRSFGDKNQALYHFIGAGGFDFNKKLNLEILCLTKSYRLTKQNAALANHIIKNTKYKINCKTSGKLPRLISCEWNNLYTNISKKVLRHSKYKNTIGILARTKTLLREADQSLRANGIWGNPRFEKEFLHIISACSWIEENTIALRNPNIQPCMTLLDINATTFSKTIRNYIVQAAKSTCLESRFELITKAYVAFQDKSKREEIRNELRLWLPTSRNHSSAKEMKDSVLKMKNDQVSFSTIHSAKGCEWDCVFVTGLIEGIIPISYAKDKIQISEERKVLYVAITRAKKRLYLYKCDHRQVKSGKLFNKLSHFVQNADRSILLKCKTK